MSRRPRLRDASAGSEGPDGEARRRWLASWKRSALTALPPETSRTDKVRVRAAVERALVRFGPEDDEAEIRDIVGGIVEEVKGGLTTEAARAARLRLKREVVDGAGELLDGVLRRFPKDQVAAMLKRPGFSGIALKARLHRFLERTITGDERPERIAELVMAWAERRLAEQPFPSTSTSRLAAGVGTAIGVLGSVGVVALQNPQIRDATVKHLKTARDKVGRWLRPPVTPQASPPARTPTS